MVVCLPPVSLAWQQPRSLALVLPAVQQNVAEFVASLPDFVCDERVQSSRLTNGAAVKTSAAESHFVGVQRKSPGGGSQYEETREVIRVGDQPAKKGARLKGPFILNGGFSGAVNSTFHADIAQYRSYRLENSEELNGKSMVVIGFSTKQGQTQIRAMCGRGGFIQTDTGKAWIDPASMQIARLDYTISNTPGKYPSWFVSVEYGPVTIGDKTFWMPKNVRSEMRQKSTEDPAMRFLAEYSNYRKFQVSSGIVESHESR